MCLAITYSKEKKKAILAKKPKKFVVWRVVYRKKGGFSALYHLFDFIAGKNVSLTGPGFFSFLHWKDAKAWAWDNKICRAIIKKTTIKNIGIQKFVAPGGKIFAETIVSSEIIMPKYIGGKK